MDTSEPDISLQDEIKALRQQLAVLRVDILGKEWLTVDEAAHYCGVSASQFNARAHEYELEPRNFMGKKLYEKAASIRQSTAPRLGRGHPQLSLLVWWQPPPRWRAGSCPTKAF